jgi:MinD superfamily P-loop ATPase
LIRIAVASGKGGTGKTTVATNLALALAGPDMGFLDCDVEAPNAHLFLKPDFNQREEVGILIPEIDEARCTFCGRCAEVCQFHAIAVIGKKTLVFPELCHGCGSCTLVCPENAISEKLDVMGTLEQGRAAGGMFFAHGLLNVGEPMAVPVIRQLKQVLATDEAQWETVILDASPGTSCPVVETIRGSDYLLLVTEPTPFGLHDLRLAVQLAQELEIPSGVILNRDGIGNSDVVDFCREAGIPILMRIPMDRGLAEALARGETLIAVQPAYRARFQELYNQIRAQVLDHKGGAK